MGIEQHGQRHGITHSMACKGHCEGDRAGAEGDTGARDALHHSRATSESAPGQFGKCQVWPHSETGGEPQHLAVDVAGFRHQLSPEEGLLSTSRNDAGPQGYQAECPKRTPTLA